MNVKQLDGAGGYEPGKLITNQTDPLTKDQWSAFTRRLDRACYWSLPSMSEEIEGNDGAQWILEGRRDGRYHVVDRWSPNGGVFRDACLYLLTLSKIEIPDSEFC